MKRTELGLIPLTYPMPSGRPPVVNRLALFGAPSPAIGTVVCAISTIDTAGGWVPDGSGGIAPEKPPAGVIWWHVLVALFPISPFGALLGALLGGFISYSLLTPTRGREPSLDLTVPLAVLFWALTMAFFVRLFARPKLPMSVGQAIVVGTDGFDECRYSEFGGGAPKRTVARYDDPATTWTLASTALVKAGAIVSVREELTVVDITTGATRAELARMVDAKDRPGGDNFDYEVGLAFARILEGALRVKGARAEAARRAGQPVAFPVLGGRPRQLVLTRTALEDHQDGRARVFPLDSLRVSVDKGVYTFNAGDGGPPMIIERPRIGDVFVFEALLKLRG
jgi:hypothetical protein